MEKYTITQFRNDYPNDDACLDKIWQVRFSNLVCPKCEKEKTYSKVNDKRSYQCSSCSHQIYPTAGTVFEKTSIPLTHWFYAIYLQTTTRNGVAAKELERQLSVCYKTALRMAHQIKKLMASDSIELLSGTIEADETLIGGLEKNKHMKDRINQTEKGKRTRKRQHVKKPIVLGMLQRGGKVKTFVIKNTSADIMQPLIRKNVEPNSRLITDAHKSYIELKHDYYHISIKHTMDNYVTYGDEHTNNIEGFWSLLKRTIKGTHIHVSTKHLQKYVDEVAFRYEHREHQDTMFECVVNRVVSA